ncbi:Fe-S cluster assembly ATPase SufC [Candidatus Woesearchaeota archaeon]|nr:Fe-S cluster assembly ATPase SufC [Candidatus Woesearchaeota archaeon]
MLDVKDLHASVEGKEILKGLSLHLAKGEVVAIMGPNGSGKSTLANVIMGHPKYEASGSVTLEGANVLAMAPDERAQKGLFLSFQYPSEIPGVTLFNFLRTAINAQRKARGEENLRLFEYTKLLEEKMALLHMNSAFKERYLNEGFSGGEKKRAEILQLAMLNPKVAILDETDSGLDIDALKIVAEGINAVKNGEKAILLITHYQRILDYIKPDRILILKDGKIVKEGGPELAHELEKEGYTGFD